MLWFYGVDHGAENVFLEEREFWSQVCFSLQAFCSQCRKFWPTPTPVGYDNSKPRLVTNKYSLPSLLQRWSKMPWTRSLGRHGMLLLARDLVLRSPMKSATCSICSLVERWRYVSGNAHKKKNTGLCVQSCYYVVLNEGFGLANTFVQFNSKNTTTNIIVKFQVPFRYLLFSDYQCYKDEK